MAEAKNLKMFKTYFLNIMTIIHHSVLKNESKSEKE